jgi:hypothetical protein
MIKWYHPGYLPPKNIRQDTIETPNILWSTIHNSQAMETKQMPYTWWMGQEKLVYIHNGVLLSHKE